MNKEEALKFYQDYNEKCNAYRLALTTIEFDQYTIAPINGSDYRIRMMAFLSGELFDHQTNEEHVKKLKEMSQMDLGPIMNREIEIVLDNVNKTALLPKEFYMEMQTVFSQGEILWRKAKKEKNYQMFKDCLKDIVRVTKQAYTYYGKKGTLYDGMLDDYETGMDMEKYEHFFQVIKDRLVPFVQKVNTEGQLIDDTRLHQHFDAEKQAKVMKILQDYMGYNPDESYMGLTEHPFTSDFSLHDVRITTKYNVDSLTSSIFSIIHEYGHALYALNVDESLEGLQVSKSMTSGIHESQSRFLENYIGRRRSFWVQNYPKVQDIFPDQLKDISLDEFVKMINASKRSLIRIEADELTYPLHILIRYELEKEMINNDVDYDTLDTLWADKYEQYLGVRPQHASEGILQDIHWPSGMFGYFPSYALGSAYGAQFLQAMKKDIDIDKELENGHFDVIVGWLKEHIHRHGALYNGIDVLEKACHQPFDANVYVDYLIEKYSQLHNIK